MGPYVATQPKPTQTADTLADNIIEEVTQDLGSQLSPSPKKSTGKSTQAEGIELRRISSLPGAADLVNNIIDGVLGPDDSLPQTSVPHDDTVLVHIAMQELENENARSKRD